MADIFAITFVIIALVITVTNKANQQKNSKAAVSSRKSQSAAAAAQKKAAPQRTAVRVPNAKPIRTVVPAAPAAPSFADAPAVAQPTVAVHHHDDDIFQGSMMAESTEGYDPCHEEQLQPEIPACEAPAPVDPYAQTQTPLFGGQSLMNAIVMNEILTRPEDRANSFGL